MAPRGGSGGSSGSDSDSSDAGSSSSYRGSSSSDTYRSSNPWYQKTPLRGSNFQVGFRVTNVVLAAIFLVLLVGVAVWAASVKRKQKGREVVRTVMGWKRWGLAISFGLIYHAFAFSADVIHEKETAVRNVYLLIEAIMLNTRFIAEILLLVTIYALLYHCTIRPGENFRSKSKSPKQMVHGVLCVLLGLLFIVILALSIRGIVEAVGELGMVIRLKRLLLNKFVVSYQALYFVASLEVLLTTVWLSVTARKHGVSKRIGFALIGLIGFPLFLRRIFVLAYGAAFSLSNRNQLTVGGYLAQIIISGFSNIITYAGIVYVVKQLANSSWNPHEAGHQGNHGPMIESLPHLGPVQYPPQQYPPQQYPPQQYPPQQYPSQPHVHELKGQGAPGPRTSELPVGHNY